jgi:heme-degrading monooxygenase HmoA
MFSVIFEVHTKSDQKDAYLGYAKLLKPELEKIDGFVDNIRYGSLRREGWLLSLSNWRDEKALIRWRTRAVHHGVQEKGRFEVFLDYHLRVGQLTQDTCLPKGYELFEQRLDVTETGEGTVVMLIDAKRPSNLPHDAKAEIIATWLGLDPAAEGLISWDVYAAVLKPGDLILVMSWRDNTAVEAYLTRIERPERGRLRRVRVIRDYGMFDRREAPQYYADIKPSSPQARLYGVPS